MSQEIDRGPRRDWPQNLVRVAEVLGLSALAVGASFSSLGCRAESVGSIRQLSERDRTEAATAMETYRNWVDTLSVRGVFSPEETRIYAALQLEDVVAFSPKGDIVINMHGKVDEVAALLQASDGGWRETFAQKGIVESPESALAQLTDTAKPLAQRIQLARKWTSEATGHFTP